MQEFATRKAIARRMDLRLLNCLLRKYRVAVRIMKLTIILLAACLQLSARGLTQTVTISVKDAPLLTVLKAIKKQTGFVFYITSEELKRAKNVSITANNLPLEQVLDMCFRDQPLTYSINGKLINITPRIQQTDKANDRTNFTAPLPANIDVSGKVMDENGGPLAGANVVEKGKQYGTTTNADGVFVLKDVDENGSLEISYIGYQTLTVPINKRTSIAVAIKQSEASLQEVVINKGYYSEAKKFSTGNVTQITSKDIEQQPVQNPLLALEGRVPGLVITQLTGMNGGGVTARIQGINSIGILNGGTATTGTDPLIVIDGVPYPSKFQSSYMETIVAGGSPLNYINTSEIESISVLKDADATSIYGSRAANGAILITTKKAKAGKPKLSVDYQEGWGKVNHFANMMNTSEYLSMRNEAYKNDGINLATQTISSSNYDLKLWDTTRYTNWQKELIGGTAQYMNVNASFSGGSSTVQYLVGANFSRQTTVFPGNYDDKVGGLHFNLNGASPNQRLRIQLSGSYTYDENRLPNIDLTNTAILLEPDAPKLYNSDGTLNWAPTASGTSSWNNPLARLFASEFSNTTRNLLSGMNIAYTVLPNLVLSSNFGYNDIRSDLFQGFKLGYAKPESRASFSRQANFGTRDISSFIIEPQLQYSKHLGKGMVDGLVGTTIQKTRGTYLIIQTSGQPNDDLLHSMSAATSVTGINLGTGGDYVTKFNGLFGRVNYNWDKKYIINLTGRRDGSSKFGDQNKFHNFWSVGTGWIFSEEKWIQNAMPFISFGKLRASYGTTGNDQIADYSYLSLYNLTSTNILYQGGTGFILNTLSNSSLQWEETRKLQGGIDLGFVNDRVAFGITYARNRSSNQLINYTLPDVTGFASYLKNLPATVQNTSWEFSLNSVNVKSQNLTWSTNFNLTIPRNKVINFPGIQFTSYAAGNSGIIVGQPIGIKKLYQYGGIDPATGNYTLLDSTGKTVSSISSLTGQSQSVSTLPKWYGGLSNTITYKGFQLDFLFQFVYQKGSKDLFYQNESGAVPGVFGSGLSNQPVSVLSRWQKTGDVTDIGRFTMNRNFRVWADSYTNEGYSYSAGSYIRLKNVSFSWQVPKKWSSKAHLQTAQLYFRGQNLLTITKYTGLDPESRSLTSLPPLRMLTVGTKIEL